MTFELSKASTNNLFHFWKFEPIVWLIFLSSSVIVWFIFFLKNQSKVIVCTISIGRLPNADDYQMLT